MTGRVLAVAAVVFLATGCYAHRSDIDELRYDLSVVRKQLEEFKKENIEFRKKAARRIVRLERKR